MWQNCLGHPSKGQLVHIAAGAVVRLKPMIEFYEKYDCQACTKAKATLLPLRKSTIQPTISYKCVDADLMSPFPETIHCFCYMLAIGDLFSHYVYVCSLPAKSDLFMALMNFVLLEEMNITSRGGHLVKRFHSDQGEWWFPGSLCHCWFKRALRKLLPCLICISKTVVSNVWIVLCRIILELLVSLPVWNIHSGHLSFPEQHMIWIFNLLESPALLYHFRTGMAVILFVTPPLLLDTVLLWPLQRVRVLRR